MSGTALSRDPRWTQLFMAWVIALGASLGAVFLGEVMGRTPCVLCWYQRIAMFPLTVILMAGLLAFDVNVVRYALPLAVAGWAVAMYHCLLYWGIVPKDLVPCGEGISCTDAQLELVGFVTIPLLSLIAFSMIIALLLNVRKRPSQ